MTETTEPKFESWAIVELMGRVRLAGYVTEQTLAGTSMLRVDVPHIVDGKEGKYTRYFGGSAVYSISY